MRFAFVYGSVCLQRRLRVTDPVCFCSNPNMNSHFKVKNVNGTSRSPYANSSSKTGLSWLEVWRNSSKSDRETCCRLGCTSEDLVGAHVIKVDGRSSNEWWLAPLCRGCNNFNNTEEMFIDSRVALVKLVSGYVKTN
jgi:5-methylcytosine-specific restriction endonuclease McrA